MKNITLFLMTQKGYQLLADTVGDYGKLFARVVIGKDAALDDDYSEKLRDLCEKHDIEWSFRGADQKIGTEYALAVGWRWMIDFPQDKLIVFHDSLLPRYRGFNPLVSALINGDEKVGVTALFGSDRYDAGPIIAQSSMTVEYPCKISDAIDRITACYSSAALEVFEKIASGEQIHGTPQDESAASYSLWRDSDDYRIDWNRPAVELERTINAVGSPYAGALTEVNGRLAKIAAARSLADVRIENRVIGKVIWLDDHRPVVVCGEGLLQLDELIDPAAGESLLPLDKFRSRFS